jgi:predicted HTH domain antitoxin
MNLVIPDDLAEAVGLSEAEMFQMLVLTLFEKEKISLGKAAKLLDMTQPSFQSLLADKGLYIHYGVEDFREDVASLKADGLLSAIPHRGQI